jgi:amino acid transporter
MPATKNFGTAPVFFTAIATILGAILFLRFGFAVGMLGFTGTMLVIFLGHLVTIPTALAISEIATNKRVEGGGEYFIISRSFGLNIGATIGFALYLSQAISVAFYVIAFTEAFEPFFNYMSNRYNLELPRQVISIPAMLGLSILILRKGANMGVKALYVVVGILFISLIMFFLGKTGFSEKADFDISNAAFTNKDKFFFVFAIIFPAFTGMTAGVGLSGELKKPSRSIPLGTILATVSGMIIYIFIAYKFKNAASVEKLINDQLVMSDIAIGGSILIPLGLAASTVSSAIGSVMVAPRTLQALAKDRSLPSKRLNNLFGRINKDTGEPYNATLFTVIVALGFVAVGDVNAVAQIISMFFMVTYGSLCLISFLNHFGSSPSYRPSFKSRWYISLIGFLFASVLMFAINFVYAVAAVILMTLIYILTNYYHKDRRGLEAIFTNSLFQLNRNLQVYLQKTAKSRHNKEWRPSAICINKHSFNREGLFRVLNWISFRYGFGTYIHLKNGYYSREESEKATEDLQRLIQKYDKYKNHVYIDTLLSPSYTSAIAQAIQLPGISGMENNMVIFEFDKENPAELKEILENIALVKAGKFDICILGSSKQPFHFKKDIHVWIRSTDHDNSHLLILLSYIILGHNDWKKSNIKIFDLCKQGKEGETRQQLEELIIKGRLPITVKNIEIIPEDPGTGFKKIINQKSLDAGLTLIGFREDAVKHQGVNLFTGYEEMGNILFINSHSQKEI